MYEEYSSLYIEGVNIEVLIYKVSLSLSFFRGYNKKGMDRRLPI